MYFPEQLKTGKYYIKLETEKGAEWKKIDKKDGINGKVAISLVKDELDITDTTSVSIEVTNTGDKAITNGRIAIKLGTSNLSLKQSEEKEEISRIKDATDSEYYVMSNGEEIILWQENGNVYIKTRQKATTGRQLCKAYKNRE